MTDILDRKLIPSAVAATSAVADETLILHLVNGNYYGLDPVGTRIWEMIGEGVAPPDICRRIAVEYAVDVLIVESDARSFLSNLEAQGILVDG